MFSRVFSTGGFNLRFLNGGSAKGIPVKNILWEHVISVAADSSEQGEALAYKTDFKLTTEELDAKLRKA